MVRTRHEFTVRAVCRSLFLMGLLLSGAPPIHAADRFREAVSSITEHDLRQHLSFLASDALEGREAGTRGGQAAAAYIADRLRALGCAPAGDEGSLIQEFGRGYRNVLGVIPGSDPQRAHEYILIGGHLDHVGYGTSLNSNGPLGRIHNGADDNASGVSAILEIAEALTRLPSALPRSVLFALWDGEEKGLLGSKHWVNHPTIELSQLKLAMNLDMVGRLSDRRVTIYGARTARGLRQFLVAANEEPGLTLDFSSSQNSDSDHYNFYEKGVPYLMLYTGEHPDYHRPSDDVDRINFPGLEALTRMHLRILAAAAEATEAAAFRKEVRDEARTGRVAFESLPARLGVTWPPNRQPGEPFTVVAVDPRSPAGQAGVRVGDRIIQVGTTSAAGIGDLRLFLTDRDCDLQMICERPEQESPLTLTLKLAGAACPVGVRVAVDPADGEGLYVQAVDPNSPAGKAGIQAGDRLIPQPAPRDSDGPADGRVRSWTVETAGRLRTVSLP